VADAAGLMPGITYCTRSRRAQESLSQSRQTTRRLGREGSELLPCLWLTSCRLVTKLSASGADPTRALEILGWALKNSGCPSILGTGDGSPWPTQFQGYAAKLQVPRSTLSPCKRAARNHGMHSLPIESTSQVLKSRYMKYCHCVRGRSAHGQVWSAAPYLLTVAVGGQECMNCCSFNPEQPNHNRPGSKDTHQIVPLTTAAHGVSPATPAPPMMMIIRRHAKPMLCLRNKPGMQSTLLVWRVACLFSARVVGIPTLASRASFPAFGFQQASEARPPALDSHTLRTDCRNYEPAGHERTPLHVNPKWLAPLTTLCWRLADKSSSIHVYAFRTGKPDLGSRKQSQQRIAADVPSIVCFRPLKPCFI